MVGKAETLLLFNPIRVDTPMPLSNPGLSILCRQLALLLAVVRVLVFMTTIVTLEILLVCDYGGRLSAAF